MKAALLGMLSLGLLTAPPASASPIINEFVANHGGSDTHEFIEIFGAPGTDYSNYSLLQLEGDSPGGGVIDTVIVLGTTDANGFWYTGFLNNSLENGTFTLLLVDSFTGSVGTDLDTNNDGLLDVTPWQSIIDSVAVSDGGAGDLTYSSLVLGPGFDGGVFTPGGASRIPNGVNTGTVADWMRNDFDGEGFPGFTGTPIVGEALNTPGTLNSAFGQPPHVVPEPGTLALLGVGLAAFGLRRRRQA